MVTQNGHRRVKRSRALKPRGSKPKVTYWDILRWAESNPDIPPASGVLRTNVRQNTGMALSGEFISFRDNNGQIVFYDENGTIIRK
jgi:hypothetical protein